jgi:hypothetical protein
MCLFLFLGGFWLLVASYTIDSYSNQWDVGSVKVRMFAPKYISPNEEEEIRFSVENGSSDQAQVTFKLVSDGPLMSFGASSENNDFYSGQIERKGQVNHQMKVFFPFDRHQPTPILNQGTGLSLWAAIGNAELQKIANLPLNTAPIPKARAITNYLGALLAALVLWMCKEVWEQVKA